VAAPPCPPAMQQSRNASSLSSFWFAFYSDAAAAVRHACTNPLGALGLAPPFLEVGGTPSPVRAAGAKADTNSRFFTVQAPCPGPTLPRTGSEGSLSGDLDGTSGITNVAQIETAAHGNSARRSRSLRRTQGLGLVRQLPSREGDAGGPCRVVGRLTTPRRTALPPPPGTPRQATERSPALSSAPRSRWPARG